MIKPNLFIVGMPRTGTHALHDLLNQHPLIHMSVPKEPLFFVPDLHRESDRFHGRARYFPFRTEQQYLDVFKGASGQEKHLGESSTVYLYSSEAAARIYQYNPDSKIIMMFREPVSWLRSFHSEAVHSLGEDITDLQEALEKEELRKQGKFLSTRVPAPSLLFYSEYLNYTHHLSKFTDIFPRENIKLIIYDDFARDNLAVFREILNFLHLDPEFTPEIREINKSKTRPRFPRLQYILQAPRLRQIVFKLLPTRLYSGLVRFYWEKLFSFKEKQQLSNLLKMTLKKKYKSQVQAFASVIGGDLMDTWNYRNI